MPMDAFEEDIARPFGVPARGGRLSPKLIKILRINTTSWVVPRSSLYTIYFYGQSAVQSGTILGGSFLRKQVRLPAGAVCACVIPRGANAQGGVGNSDSRTASITLPNLTLSIFPLGTPVGGDYFSLGSSSLSGGDGSDWGEYYGNFSLSNYFFGVGPGAPIPAGAANGGQGGHAEIRIVDEEPA